jgi:hypothetical protein
MRNQWLTLLVLFPLLLTTVPAHAEPQKKVGPPWQISMRCGALLVVVAAVAASAYSVGERYQALAPGRDRMSYELQSVPFTDFPDREALRQTLIKVAFRERRNFQRRDPEYLRQTLQFYAQAHPTIAASAKAKGVPLDDDRAFIAFLGLTLTKLDTKEVRPLVDPPLPGVISHRDAVDELMAEIYLLQIEWATSVGKVEFIDHSGITGDEGKPFTAVHSFTVDWHTAKKNDFFTQSHLDANAPGRDPGMYHAGDIALYLRHQWRREQRDTGAMIRKLFETHPEAVQRAYDCEGPGMVRDLVKLDDGARFNQLAGGPPYGFNRENLELIDHAIGEMVRDFATEVKSKERQLTARQLIEEFIKANGLE